MNLLSTPQSTPTRGHCFTEVVVDDTRLENMGLLESLCISGKETRKVLTAPEAGLGGCVNLGPRTVS